MANNVRFVDSLKVGAYQTEGSSGGGSGITINNNVNAYIDDNASVLATNNVRVKANSDRNIDLSTLNISFFSSPTFVSPSSIPI